MGFPFRAIAVKKLGSTACPEATLKAGTPRESESISSRSSMAWKETDPRLLASVNKLRGYGLSGKLQPA